MNEKRITRWQNRINRRINCGVSPDITLRVLIAAIMYGILLGSIGTFN